MSVNHPILQHFSYEHLPPSLAAVSQKFHDLAVEIAEIPTYDAEVGVSLRKLLEAKDAAVRAKIIADREANLVGKS